MSKKNLKKKQKKKEWNRKFEDTQSSTNLQIIDCSRNRIWTAQQTKSTAPPHGEKLQLKQTPRKLRHFPGEQGRIRAAGAFLLYPAIERKDASLLC